MTKTLLWMCAAFVLAAAPASARTSPAAPAREADELAGVPRISQADFKQALAAGSILVLDVRDAASYANGHIPGARSIPLDDLRKHLSELRAEKRPIVTYCAWPAEHTSARAALDLREAGIRNVRALAGGIPQWIRDGNRVVKGSAAK